MTVKIYKDLIQGSDEWFQARCGILTASEMNLILTPTLKIANNDKTRAHVYEILGQRITNYVEPCYIGEHMVRGEIDEIRARDLYSEKYEAVNEVGFITNDEYGFKLGYSPDGLVGSDGLIEIKSKIQKHHVKTICDGGIPKDHVLQVQAGLLITGRKWCDFISYCGGMPMYVHRVRPDKEIQDAIIEATQEFEEKVEELRFVYDSNVKGMLPTEREITTNEEIIL